MIDINKKYRTRGGHPARLYAVDAGGCLPIHGAVQGGKLWIAASWNSDGRISDIQLNPSDLIEVRTAEDVAREAFNEWRFDPPSRALPPEGTICQALREAGYLREESE